MKHITVFLIACLSISSSFAADPGKSPDQYWQQICQVAASQFGGLDLNPVLKTGYQFSGDYAGPGVGLSVDLPLWSKKKRIENRKQAVEFRAAGAELVRKLETALETLALLNEQAKVLRAIMSEEGVEGVKALFEVQKEIIVQRAEETQYRRELEGMIAPLNGEAIIKTPVKPVSTKGGT
jgi:hypothetical protein